MCKSFLFSPNLCGHQLLPFLSLAHARPQDNCNPLNMFTSHVVASSLPVRHQKLNIYITQMY